ncbi:lipopolysaccharide biosynthesis protein [Nitrosomonas marina]|uniref:Membrane protein involved in the export of O-antigen and teichoic acid n=1 Tax=Nitrosomonas marina TaxID=917 RepID=A0A1H8AKF2_9PROT|nr:lipopolysaccharide biosynthesis protein [Nitrosomonas marina]SEM70259.1 Membrane protein involved in the export of O-antigen and teichoic acid [Nitrosomonas marina]
MSQFPAVDIKAKVLSGLRWTISARFASQLISWMATIFVIRLLNPEDYGLLAMATVFISFLVLLNTLGLDAPLVQKKDLTEEERRRIFGVIIVANLTIFTGLFLSAPFIASFFDEPSLTAIVRVLSTTFLIDIFMTLPLATLDREIAFKHRSIIEFVTTIVSSLSTLALAYYGFGVWSLVYGSLLSHLLKTIGLNLIAPSWCKPDFSLTGLKSLFLFGSFVTLERGLWHIHSESDKLIGGRIMGADLLGYFAVASHLASFPIQKLSSLIQSIAFPAFSKAKQITDKTGIYFLKASQVASVITFPVFLGISCIAPELVKIFLGEKWEPAILPLQILVLVMPFRALGNIITPLLWGIGMPRVSATNLLIAAIVMPIAFLIGSQWGPVGLSLCWILVFPFIYLVYLVRTCPLIGIKITDCLKTITGPMISSILMYLCVTSINPYLFGSSGDIPHLMQLIAIGAVTYLSVMLAFFRNDLLTALNSLRN